MIDYKEIEKELTDYDERRELFFGKIYAFEKKVYLIYTSDFAILPIIIPNKPNRIFYEHKDYMTEATKRLTDQNLVKVYNNNIVLLRNKAFHNQLVSKTFFSTLDIVIDDTKSYVNQVFDIAEKYYKDLLAMI